MRSFPFGLQSLAEQPKLGDTDRLFFSLAFPSALTLGTLGDLPGIVTWRKFTTPGTGAPITGPP